MEMMFGIFQHFNYFDSEEVIDGSGRIPYKISEAASVGPGMIYKFPQMNSLVNLEQRVFLSAILLGGSLTDYYNVIDRNYNMGSGYSIKNNTILDFGRSAGGGSDRGFGFDSDSGRGGLRWGTGCCCPGSCCHNLRCARCTGWAGGRQGRSSGW